MRRELTVGAVTAEDDMHLDPAERLLRDWLEWAAADATATRPRMRIPPAHLARRTARLLRLSAARREAGAVQLPTGLVVLYGELTDAHAAVVANHNLDTPDVRESVARVEVVQLAARAVTGREDVDLVLDRAVESVRRCEATML